MQRCYEYASFPDRLSKRIPEYEAVSSELNCPACGQRLRVPAGASPKQVRCPQCGNSKLPHCACDNCGYVNPKLSLQVETQES